MKRSTRDLREEYGEIYEEIEQQIKEEKLQRRRDNR